MTISFLNGNILQTIIERILDEEIVIVTGDLFTHLETDTEDYPSLRILAQRINKMMGNVQVPNAPFGEVSRQLTEQRKSSQFLHQFIRDQLSDPNHLATKAHQYLAKLPVQRFIYLGWDPGLEIAYLREKKKANLIWEPDQLHFLSEKIPAVILPLGYCKTPSTMILTDQEMNLVDRQRPEIYRKVEELLSQKCALFVGEFSDYLNVLFRILYQSKSDFYTPNRYVVQAVGAKLIRQTWEGLGVEVIEAELDDFLEALLGAVEQEKKRRFEASHVILEGEPYLFVDYYTEKHAELFFGRRQDIEQVCRRLEEQNLLVLYGDSGVGKTSLLRAGIGSVLSNRAVVIYLRPGVKPRKETTPLNNLRDALLNEVSSKVNINNILTQPLAKQIESLLDICWKQQAGISTIILFLDQFEEIFTNLGELAQHEFLNHLRHLLDSSIPLKIIVAIRGDCNQYLDDLVDMFPEFKAKRERLKNFDDSQAREIITRPMRSYGITVSSSLVERLVKDLKGEKGIDPSSLAIVLTRLYKALPPDVKTLDEVLYKEVGPADRILEEYVDEALENFPEMDRKQAILVLRALATSEGRKASVSLGDVIFECGLKEEVVIDLLEKLVGSRLVRKREGEFPYEIAHDRVAKKIVETLTDPERDRKRIREMLSRELNDHQAFQSYISKEKINAISLLSETEIVSQEILALILASCYLHNLPTHHWPTMVTSKIALKPLLVASEDRDPNERITALRDLGKVPMPAARQRMLEMLNERENPKVLFEILEHISQEILPGDVPYVTKLLDHPSSEVRERSIIFLTASQSSEVVEFLIRATNDETAAVRLAGVMGLTQLKSPRAILAMVDLLENSPFPEVSELVESNLLRLSQTGPDRQVVATVLVEFLTMSGRDRILRVIKLLAGFSNDETCARALENIIKDKEGSSTSNRLAALQSLAANAPRDKVINIARQIPFTEEASLFTQGAALILKRLNTDPDIFLSLVYGSQDPVVRGIAMSALAQQGKLFELPIEWIDDAVFHQDADVRQAAVKALRDDVPTLERSVLLIQVGIKESERNIQNMARDLPEPYRIFIRQNAGMLIDTILSRDDLPDKTLNRSIKSILGEEVGIKEIASFIVRNSLTERCHSESIVKAVRWLKNRDSEGAINQLLDIALLAGPNNEVTRDIQDALLGSTPAWVGDILLDRVIKEQEEEKRIVLLGCLRSVGFPDEGISQLGSVLKPNDVRSRERTLHKLLSEPKPFQRQIAQLILEYPDEGLREVAIRALGEWKLRNSVEILEHAYFREQSFYLRECIIDMIAEIHDGETEAALRRITKKENNPIQVKYIQETIESITK